MSARFSERRATSEARVSVGDLLPGYLVHKVTGERQPHGGLSPRQVPKAWVQGLKDAGVESVKIAQVRRDGGWRTLPLVIQFECPFDHVDDTGETWAKVRLKVNPYTGWVSIHQDSCRRCTQQQVEAWLLTCPRCAAGEELDAHPDHDSDDDWCLFVTSCGDESPIAHVIEVMWQFQRGEALVADSKMSPASVESVTQWLDSLTREDGSPLVLSTLGQSAAWDLVKPIPGCPTQSLVRKAQAQRKTAGTV